MQTTTYIYQSQGKNILYRQTGVGDDGRIIRYIIPKEEWLAKNPVQEGSILVVECRNNGGRSTKHNTMPGTREGIERVLEREWKIQELVERHRQERQREEEERHKKGQKSKKMS
jgi:hypothetical protein